MKFSNYLCKFDSGEEWIVYSPYTNVAVDISKELYDAPEKICDEDKRYLVDNFFLISEKINEKEMVRALYTQKKHATFAFVYIPTFLCNLKCEYCYQKDLEKNAVKRATNEKIVEWVQRNISKEVKVINVQLYGGEPLIEKQKIICLLDLLNRTFKDIRIKVSICTNGFYLDSLFLNEIVKKCEIDLIQLTVHDFDKNRTEYHRQIINNINQIASYSRWNLVLKFDVNKTNFQYIESFLQEIDNKSCYSVEVAPILKCNNIYDGNLFGKSEYAQLIDIEDNLKNKGYEIKRRKRFACFLLVNPDAFVVDPQGYVYKCDGMAGKREYAIGTIYDHNRFSNGLNMKEIYLSDLFNQPHKCITCELMPLCMGNCKYRNGFNSKEPVVCYEELIKASLFKDIYYKGDLKLIKRMADSNDKGIFN